MKRVGSIFFLLAAFFGMAGCAGERKTELLKEPYTVGVVTKSKDSEYWMTVCSGIEKAAKDFQVTVLIVSPDTESNGRLQGKMIDDLLDKGVDALAVSPIESYGMDQYLKKAENKHIPVVSYDTRIVSDIMEVPYIGIDNQKAGRELAAYMADRLDGKGKAGIITGDLNQTSHRERMEGFRSYIEENTSIDVAFIESGYSNLQMSEKEISRLMEEHPGVDGIFSTSAVTALGIVDYMRGTPIQIVTIDDQQDALEAVKQGRITALAAQSGYDIGYETIRYLVNEKEQAAQEGDRILNAEIVTIDNVDVWTEGQP